MKTTCRILRTGVPLSTQCMNVGAFRGGVAVWLDLLLCCAGTNTALQYSNEAASHWKHSQGWSAGRRERHRAAPAAPSRPAMSSI